MNIAAVLEIGQNLNTLLVPVTAAVVIWFQNKSNKQFKNNGGATMRDAIDRIEQGMSSIQDRLYVVEHAAKIAVDAQVTE